MELYRKPWHAGHSLKVPCFATPTQGAVPKVSGMPMLLWGSEGPLEAVLLIPGSFSPVEAKLLLDE